MEVTNKHLTAFGLLLVAVVAVLLSIVQCQKDFVISELECIQAKGRAECVGTR